MSSPIATPDNAPLHSRATQRDARPTPAAARPVIVVTLLAFGALSALAVRDHGVWGIIEPHFHSFGAGQVFADLVIALTLAMVWMWRDARARGMRPWPWIVLTLASGSFGPLLYLLFRRPRAGA